MRSVGTNKASTYHLSDCPCPDNILQCESVEWSLNETNGTPDPCGEGSILGFLSDLGTLLQVSIVYKMRSLNLLKILIFISFGKQSFGEREAERKKESPTHWFTPQMPTQSGLGQAEARSSALNPGIACGWQGPHCLGCHCCLRAYLSRKLELMPVQASPVMLQPASAEFLSGPLERFLQCEP